MFQRLWIALATGAFFFSSNSLGTDKKTRDGYNTKELNELYGKILAFNNKIVADRKQIQSKCHSTDFDYGGLKRRSDNVFCLIRLFQHIETKKKIDGSLQKDLEALFKTDTDVSKAQLADHLSDLNFSEDDMQVLYAVFTASAKSLYDFTRGQKKYSRRAKTILKLVDPRAVKHR